MVQQGNLPASVFPAPVCLIRGCSFVCLNYSKLSHERGLLYVDENTETDPHDGFVKMKGLMCRWSLCAERSRFPPTAIASPCWHVDGVYVACQYPAPPKRS